MILGGGGKLHVTGRVQGRLHRVLHHADDEADTHHLHGNIIGDAEQGAGHGDQQQGAAGHAGSTAGTQSAHGAQHDGGRQGHLNAQRVGGGQRHDGDGDGGTVHVDGGAQRDGHGIHVLIQPQLLTQGHIHGDVGGGAAGEEGGQAGLFQAAEHQRVRIAVQVDEHNERRNDEGHEQHGAHQQGQQLAVLGKDGQAIAGNVGVHQTHDAEGCQIDDPAHDLGHRIGGVGHKGLGALRADALHGNAEHAGPEQDADVVAVHDGRHGVGHKVGEQGAQHFAQTLGHHVGLGGIGQHDGHREQEAGHHRNGSGQEGGEHVQPDHRAKAAVQPGRTLCQGACHDHEHQHRGNALQCADEQVAELSHPTGTRGHQCQHHADCQADEDAQDQTDAVVFCNSSFQGLHTMITLLFMLYASCVQFSVSYSRTSVIIAQTAQKRKYFQAFFSLVFQFL